MILRTLVITCYGMLETVDAITITIVGLSKTPADNMWS